MRRIKRKVTLSSKAQAAEEAEQERLRERERERAERERPKKKIKVIVSPLTEGEDNKGAAEAPASSDMPPITTDPTEKHEVKWAVCVGPGQRRHGNPLAGRRRSIQRGRRRRRRSAHSSCAHRSPPDAPSPPFAVPANTQVRRWQIVMAPDPPPRVPGKDVPGPRGGRLSNRSCYHCAAPSPARCLQPFRAPPRSPTRCRDDASVGSKLPWIYPPKLPPPPPAAEAAPLRPCPRHAAACPTLPCVSRPPPPSPRPPPARPTR